MVDAPALAGLTALCSETRRLSDRLLMRASAVSKGEYHVRRRPCSPETLLAARPRRRPLDP